MPLFGQVVLGPPGAGKSTYTAAMQQFLEAQGRVVSVVNMDPANDQTPYTAQVDITQLISIDDVMKHKRLGPNGGLVYCMEYIESRLDWLRAKLAALEQHCGRTYLLLDFPGQIELYTHHDSVKQILKAITKWGHRLTVVNLADSHYCSQPHTYISLVLTTLAEMIQLEMPQINVLSKADLLRNFGPLPFRLEYFTDVHDLSQLLALLQDDPLLAPYKQLSKSLCQVIESYALVQFQLLNIQDAKCLAKIAGAADAANGFVYHETDAPLDIRHTAKLKRDKQSVDDYDPVQVYDPS